MGSNKRLLRISAWLAATSLSLPFTQAYAQPATPAGAEQAGDDNTDPPALAGRLSQLTGSVSFHAAGESQWAAATLNYPVTNGLSFWTEPRAGAAMEIADSRLVMDESTEIDMTALDQGQIAATEPQGALFLQLNTVPSPQGVSLSTPRGTVQITASGRYEVVAGDTNNATSITVVEGAAHVAGPGLSLDIGPQQTATIDGSDTLQGTVGPLQQDAFLQAQLRQPAPQPAAALPRQARYMTGAADLQQYGSFTQSAQYGAVWYPSDVARDWAPYRDGHWAYVQPWGWTWVDNARWGFAPFHYGRWVQVDDRWGWVAGGGDPGYANAYPVYSPALVSFVDVGGAALAGAALGFAAGELAGGYAPAWIPLGPREPYYPWYHTRADYFGQINRPYGVPQAIILRGPTYVTNINQTNTFINRRAATVIPAGAFARGVSLRGVARALPERALLQARPVIGRLPVVPTAFTPNLPPSAARRFNVTLPPRPVRPIAAGPRILPVAAGGRGPALRPAALPGNLRPIPGQTRPGLAEHGGRPVPGALEPRPGVSRPGAGPALGGAGGLPPLRTPGGARPEAASPGNVAGAPGRHGPAETGRTPGGVQPDRGARPGQATSPDAGQLARPGRPEIGRPGEPLQPRPPAEATPARPELGRPELGRPGVGRPESGRPEPGRPEPGRPEPGRPQLGRPQPGHPEPGRPEAPRVQQPRPERVQAPRPAARPEMTRPAPRPEPARPPVQPRAEAPRPSAPRPEMTRPAARPEASRPAPRAEAPRPEPRPAPRPEAPRPAPPAPRPPPAAPRQAPQPHPAPHKPGQPQD